MRLVVVESPFSGDVERNLRYLRACLRDCILRGESPYASHALLTQPGVLRDDLPHERNLGIAAGFVWRGITHGMIEGLVHAYGIGHPIEPRMLGPDWETSIPRTEKNE